MFLGGKKLDNFNADGVSPFNNGCPTKNLSGPLKTWSMPTHRNMDPTGFLATLTCFTMNP